MKTDAFLLLGKIMQNHLIIQSIKIKKKGFSVRWTDGGKTKYKFNELEVDCFLELYEDQEEQLKK